MSDSLAPWGVVAQRRGGTCELSAATGPRLEVSSGSARLAVDTDRVVDRYPSTLVRVRARFVLGAGPEFSLARPVLSGHVKASLGARARVLGLDQEFDQLFLLRSDSESVAQLWSLERQRQLVERFGDGAVASDGQLVTAVAFGLDHSADKIDALIAFVAELVEYPSGSLRALQSMPGGEYVAPSGSWDARSLPRAELLAPAAITVGPRHRSALTAQLAPEQRLAMAAWTREPSRALAGRTGVVVIEAGGSLAGSLPEGGDLPWAADYLPRIGDAELSWCDGCATVEWKSPLVSGAQLSAGAGLLAVISQPGLGPYR